MKKLLMLIVFLFFGIIIQNATACNCNHIDSLEEAYNKSDIIVQGIVVSSKIEWLIDSLRYKEFINSGASFDTVDKYFYSYDLMNVQVKIEKVFKGKLVEDTITIYTGTRGGNCGFAFIAGLSFIIFGEKNSYFGEHWNNIYFPNRNDFYWTAMCTRTKKSSYFDTKALEEYVKNLEKE